MLALNRLALAAASGLLLAAVVSAEEPSGSGSRLDAWLEGPTLTGDW